MRKRKGLKLLALMLSAIMCINSVNLSVFAEESTEVVEETVEMSTSEISTEIVVESSEATEEETSVTEESVTPVETVTDDAEEETESDASEETEQESVEEQKTESVYEGSNYKVTFALNNQWEGGYNANVKIENTGDSTIENWYLSFALDNAITNIWNAQIDSREENEYVIKNAGWNADIPVGGSVEFGISSNENFTDFPKNYTLLGESTEADEDDYTVEYIVDSDWGSGFTGRILITNNTEETIEDWVLEFDFDRAIVGIWDGVIASYENNHYVIKNVGYNSNIAPGATISVGFNGQDGDVSQEPSDYILYSYSQNVVEDETEPEKQPRQNRRSSRDRTGEAAGYRDRYNF